MFKTCLSRAMNIGLPHSRSFHNLTDRTYPPPWSHAGSATVKAAVERSDQPREVSLKPTSFSSAEIRAALRKLASGARSVDVASGLGITSAPSSAGRAEGGLRGGAAVTRWPPH